MPCAARRAGRFRMILNFGISERLRAFRYPIFTEGGVEENCLSTVALFPMKKGENAIRSAALSQKAALQMLFAFTTPPVKRQFWKIRRFSRIAK